MKMCYEAAAIKITIHWSKPELYESIIDSDDDYAYLYMITGQYGLNSQEKIFYIGKAVKQNISKRLNQRDHRARYKELREKNRNHKIYVRFGLIEFHEGKSSDKQIDEIESILIYAMPLEHTINNKSLYSHNITRQYIIKNRGYHFSKVPLSKKIALGIFEVS